jgi:hypothetical protein
MSRDKPFLEQLIRNVAHDDFGPSLRSGPNGSHVFTGHRRVGHDLDIEIARSSGCVDFDGGAPAFRG